MSLSILSSAPSACESPAGAYFDELCISRAQTEKAGSHGWISTSCSG